MAEKVGLSRFVMNPSELLQVLGFAALNANLPCAWG